MLATVNRRQSHGSQVGSHHQPSPGKTISSGSPLLWTIFFEHYDLVDQAKLPTQIDSYVRWAPMVARYSFRTGRLLN